MTSPLFLSRAQLFPLRRITSEVGAQQEDSRHKCRCNRTRPENLFSFMLPFLRGRNRPKGRLSCITSAIVGAIAVVSSTAFVSQHCMVGFPLCILFASPALNRFEFSTFWVRILTTLYFISSHYTQSLNNPPFFFALLPLSSSATAGGQQAKSTATHRRLRYQ